MSDDVWQDSMIRALTRQNTKLKWLREGMKDAIRKIEDGKNYAEKIAKELDEEIESSDEDLKKRLSRRNDPVVYVRNYGETTVAVYHGSLDCGWVNPARSRGLLLSEAIDAGLRPCVSCGHMASSGGTSSAAA